MVVLPIFSLLMTTLMMNGTPSGGSTSASKDGTRLLFRHALPECRLGTEHASLAAYRDATDHFQAPSRKEYTLIVVTGCTNNNNSRKILLGQKHRGFGKGFYNSFGGKVETNETVSLGAVRELEEETGIAIPEAHMAQSRVGTLHFTFADGSVEMVVHLFRIRVAFRDTSTCTSSTATKDSPEVVWLDSPTVIRGCEEITPLWFEDWREIPLNKMFADDSVWLTHVLEAKTVVHLDAWFHFQAGGQDTNTILHYFLDLKNCDSPTLVDSISRCSTSTTAETATIGTNADEQTTTTTNDENHMEHFSLEKRLFHALHSVKSPSIKEFNEAFAFVNAVRSTFGQSNRQRRHAWDYVIDVAGGHGAVAALFLLTTAAHTATVVDPARVGQIETAWGPILQQQRHPKTLQFRHECLRTGLPAELSVALQSVQPDQILVVACHACQHLSDEILELACRHGVHAAVMPCCQRDPSPGSAWKSSSQRLDIPIGTTMDLLLAGKCMSWGMQYDVRLKFVDPKITPQNRIIVCRAMCVENIDRKEKEIDKAHRKLAGAYRRAHGNENSEKSWESPSPLYKDARFLGGTAFGVLLACAFLRR